MDAKTHRLHLLISGKKLQKVKLEDGWYVLGQGMSIPADDEKEADEIIKDINEEWA